MESQSLKITVEELDRIETSLKENRILKEEPVTKIQLVILYKLELLHTRLDKIEKWWMTPLIH